MKKRLLIFVVCYNAESFIEKVLTRIPDPIFKNDQFDTEILIIDDQSSDQTFYHAANYAQQKQELKIRVLHNPKNQGYGGNQKTCYEAALKAGADIVIMLHPDYQYTPKLIGAMSYLLESGEFDIVLGSRILGGKTRSGGMPVYKYIFNRILTLVQNIIMGAKLSEYHTGYRAYTRKVLEGISWRENSNDFVFDNQFLSQAIYADFRIGEITCPTKYFKEASSINFSRSVKYGLGCLSTAMVFRLNKMGIMKSKLFKK